ncbi:2OG-Fe dioxygenase family protein [Oleiagrimonas citrea]|jgi:hypothetical protein|nr:2OG-Fe dioxygenase family protein [Oleiagrimonas citrea]
MKTSANGYHSAMQTPHSPQEAPSLASLAEHGYAFVQGPALHALLTHTGDLRDWDAFADSWNRLQLDTYMADQGRYRRRRHAAFRIDREHGIQAQPPQPHFQSIEYNRLNGGIERWYQPVEPAIASGPTLTTVLKYAWSLFGTLAPTVAAWHVEVHQFRIEAHPDWAGRPTPEGVHRDGVDYVLVLLVDRRNIDSGTTTIHAPDGTELGSFTLARPLDAALVDDARVFHGVTPVTPHDASREAHRDVLVVTFRRT